MTMPRDLGSGGDLLTPSRIVHEHDGFCTRARVRASSSPSLLSSLELSDANVYESYMRALLGTTFHFCEVVALVGG